MTQSMTEKIGTKAVDALHEAIGIAWQAGYDKALQHVQEHEEHIIQQIREDIGE
jgi:hypothetical protein